MPFVGVSGRLLDLLELSDGGRGIGDLVEHAVGRLEHAIDRLGGDGDLLRLGGARTSEERGVCFSRSRLPRPAVGGAVSAGAGGAMATITARAFATAGDAALGFSPANTALAFAAAGNLGDGCLGARLGEGIYLL